MSVPFLGETLSPALTEDVGRRMPHGGGSSRTTVPQTDGRVAMIIGAHAIILTKDAEGVRGFPRRGRILIGRRLWRWLIVALPPAKLAVHPTDDETRHALYLMCDDVHATVEELHHKGVEFTRPMTNDGCYLITAPELPDSRELDLYERTGVRSGRFFRASAHRSLGVPC